MRIINFLQVFVVSYAIDTSIDGKDVRLAANSWEAIEITRSSRRGDSMIRCNSDSSAVIVKTNYDINIEESTLRWITNPYERSIPYNRAKDICRKYNERLCSREEICDSLTGEAIIPHHGYEYSYIATDDGSIINIGSLSSDTSECIEITDELTYVNASSYYPQMCCSAVVNKQQSESIITIPDGLNTSSPYLVQLQWSRPGTSLVSCYSLNDDSSVFLTVTSLPEESSITVERPVVFRPSTVVLYAGERRGSIDFRISSLFYNNFKKQSTGSDLYVQCDIDSGDSVEMIKINSNPVLVESPEVTYSINIDTVWPSDKHTTKWLYKVACEVISDYPLPPDTLQSFATVIVKRPDITTGSQSVRIQTMKVHLKEGQLVAMFEVQTSLTSVVDDKLKCEIHPKGSLFLELISPSSSINKNYFLSYWFAIRRTSKTHFNYEVKIICKIDGSTKPAEQDSIIAMVEPLLPEVSQFYFSNLEGYVATSPSHVSQLSYITSSQTAFLKLSFDKPLALDATGRCWSNDFYLSDSIFSFKGSTDPMIYDNYPVIESGASIALKVRNVNEQHSWLSCDNKTTDCGTSHCPGDIINGIEWDTHIGCSSNVFYIYAADIVTFEPKPVVQHGDIILLVSASTNLNTISCSDTDPGNCTAASTCVSKLPPAKSDFQTCNDTFRIYGKKTQPYGTDLRDSDSILLQMLNDGDNYNNKWLSCGIEQNCTAGWTDTCLGQPGISEFLVNENCLTYGGSEFVVFQKGITSEEKLMARSQEYWSTTVTKNEWRDVEGVNKAEVFFHSETTTMILSVTNSSTHPDNIYITATEDSHEISQPYTSFFSDHIGSYCQHDYFTITGTLEDCQNSCKNTTGCSYISFPHYDGCRVHAGVTDNCQFDTFIEQNDTSQTATETVSDPLFNNEQYTTSNDESNKALRIGGSSGSHISIDVPISKLRESISVSFFIRPGLRMSPFEVGVIEKWLLTSSSSTEVAFNQTIIIRKRHNGVVLSRSQQSELLYNGRVFQWVDLASGGGVLLTTNSFCLDQNSSLIVPHKDDALSNCGVWFKTIIDLRPDVSLGLPIFSTLLTGFGSSVGFSILLTPSGHVDVALTDYNSYSTYASVSVTVSKWDWTHVVVVYDSDNSLLQILANGLLVSQTTTAGVSPYLQSSSLSGLIKFYIGTSDVSLQQSALIDEISVWGIAMQISHVNLIKNCVHVTKLLREYQNIKLILSVSFTEGSVTDFMGNSITAGVTILGNRPLIEGLGYTCKRSVLLKTYCKASSEILIPSTILTSNNYNDAIESCIRYCYENSNCNHVNIKQGDQGYECLLQLSNPTESLSSYSPVTNCIIINRDVINTLKSIKREDVFSCSASSIYSNSSCLSLFDEIKSSSGVSEWISDSEGIGAWVSVTFTKRIKPSYITLTQRRSSWVASANLIEICTDMNDCSRYVISNTEDTIPVDIAVTTSITIRVLGLNSMLLTTDTAYCSSYSCPEYQIRKPSTGKCEYSHCDSLQCCKEAGFGLEEIDILYNDEMLSDNAIGSWCHEHSQPIGFQYNGPSYTKFTDYCPTSRITTLPSMPAVDVSNCLVYCTQSGSLCNAVQFDSRECWFFNLDSQFTASSNKTDLISGTHSCFIQDLEFNATAGVSTAELYKTIISPLGDNKTVEGCANGYVTAPYFGVPVPFQISGYIRINGDGCNASEFGAAVATWSDYYAQSMAQLHIVDNGVLSWETNSSVHGKSLIKSNETNLCDGSWHSFIFYLSAAGVVSFDVDGEMIAINGDSCCALPPTSSDTSIFILGATISTGGNPWRIIDGYLHQISIKSTTAITQSQDIINNNVGYFYSQIPATSLSSHSTYSQSVVSNIDKCLYKCSNSLECTAVQYATSREIKTGYVIPPMSCYLYNVNKLNIQLTDVSSSGSLSNTDVFIKGDQKLYSSYCKSVKLDANSVWGINSGDYSTLKAYQFENVTFVGGVEEPIYVHFPMMKHGIRPEKVTTATVLFRTQIGYLSVFMFEGNFEDATTRISTNDIDVSQGVLLVTDTPHVLKRSRFAVRFTLYQSLISLKEFLPEDDVVSLSISFFLKIDEFPSTESSPIVSLQDSFTVQLESHGGISCIFYSSNGLSFAISYSLSSLDDIFGSPNVSSSASYLFVNNTNSWHSVGCSTYDFRLFTLTIDGLEVNRTVSDFGGVLHKGSDNTLKIGGFLGAIDDFQILNDFSDSLSNIQCSPSTFFHNYLTLVEFSAVSEWETTVSTGSIAEFATFSSIKSGLSPFLGVGNTLSIDATPILKLSEFYRLTITTSSPGNCTDRPFGINNNPSTVVLKYSEGCDKKIETPTTSTNNDWETVGIDISCFDSSNYTTTIQNENIYSLRECTTACDGYYDSPIRCLFVEWSSLTGNCTFFVGTVFSDATPCSKENFESRNGSIVLKRNSEIAGSVEINFTLSDILWSPNTAGYPLAMLSVKSSSGEVKQHGCELDIKWSTLTSNGPSIRTTFSQQFLDGSECSAGRILFIEIPEKHLPIKSDVGVEIFQIVVSPVCNRYNKTSLILSRDASLFASTKSSLDMISSRSDNSHRIIGTNETSHPTTEFIFKFGGFPELNWIPSLALLELSVASLFCLEPYSTTSAQIKLLVVIQSTSGDLFTTEAVINSYNLISDNLNVSSAFATQNIDFYKIKIKISLLSYSSDTSSCSSDHQPLLRLISPNKNLIVSGTHGSSQVTFPIPLSRANVRFGPPIFMTGLLGGCAKVKIIKKLVDDNPVLLLEDVNLQRSIEKLNVRTTAISLNSVTDKFVESLKLHFVERDCSQLNISFSQSNYLIYPNVLFPMQDYNSMFVFYSCDQSNYATVYGRLVEIIGTAICVHSEGYSQSNPILAVDTSVVQYSAYIDIPGLHLALQEELWSEFSISFMFVANTAQDWDSLIPTGSGFLMHKMVNSTSTATNTPPATVGLGIRIISEGSQVQIWCNNVTSTSSVLSDGFFRMWHRFLLISRQGEFLLYADNVLLVSHIPSYVSQQFPYLRDGSPTRFGSAAYDCSQERVLGYYMDIRFYSFAVPLYSDDNPTHYDSKPAYLTNPVRLQPTNENFFQSSSRLYRLHSGVLLSFVNVGRRYEDVVGQECSSNYINVNGISTIEKCKKECYTHGCLMFSVNEAQTSCKIALKSLSCLPKSSTGRLFTVHLANSGSSNFATVAWDDVKSEISMYDSRGDLEVRIPYIRQRWGIGLRHAGVSTGKVSLYVRNHHVSSQYQNTDLKIIRISPMEKSSAFGVIKCDLDPPHSKSISIEVPILRPSVCDPLKLPVRGIPMFGCSIPWSGIQTSFIIQILADSDIIIVLSQQSTVTHCSDKTALTIMLDYNRRQQLSHTEIRTGMCGPVIAAAPSDLFTAGKASFIWITYTGSSLSVGKGPAVGSNTLLETDAIRTPIQPEFVHVSYWGTMDHAAAMIYFDPKVKFLTDASRPVVVTPSRSVSVELILELPLSVLSNSSGSQLIIECDSTPSGIVSLSTKLLRPFSSGDEFGSREPHFLEIKFKSTGTAEVFCHVETDTPPYYRETSNSSITVTSEYADYDEDMESVMFNPSIVTIHRMGMAFANLQFGPERVKRLHGNLLHVARADSIPNFDSTNLISVNESTNNSVRLPVFNNNYCGIEFDGDFTHYSVDVTPTTSRYVTDMSIAVTIRPEPCPQNSNQAHGCCIIATTGINTTIAEQTASIALSICGESQLSFGVLSTTQGYNGISVPINSSRWIDVLAIRDTSTHILSLYINNTLAGYTNTAVGTSSKTGSQLIGSFLNIGGGCYWKELPNSIPKTCLEVGQYFGTGVVSSKECISYASNYPDANTVVHQLNTTTATCLMFHCSASDLTSPFAHSSLTNVYIKATCSDQSQLFKGIMRRISVFDQIVGYAAVFPELNSNIDRSNCDYVVDDHDVKYKSTSDSKVSIQCSILDTTIAVISDSYYQSFELSISEYGMSMSIPVTHRNPGRTHLVCQHNFFYNLTTNENIESANKSLVVAQVYTSDISGWSSLPNLPVRFQYGTVTETPEGLLVFGGNSVIIFEYHSKSSPSWGYESGSVLPFDGCNTNRKNPSSEIIWISGCPHGITYTYNVSSKKLIIRKGFPSSGNFFQLSTSIPYGSEGHFLSLDTSVFTRSVLGYGEYKIISPDARSHQRFRHPNLNCDPTVSTPILSIAKGTEPSDSDRLVLVCKNVFSTHPKRFRWSESNPRSNTFEKNYLFWKQLTHGGYTVNLCGGTAVVGGVTESPKSVMSDSVNVIHTHDDKTGGLSLTRSEVKIKFPNMLNPVLGGAASTGKGNLYHFGGIQSDDTLENSCLYIGAPGNGTSEIYDCERSLDDSEGYVGGIITGFQVSRDVTSFSVGLAGETCKGDDPRPESNYRFGWNPCHNSIRIKYEVDRNDGNPTRTGAVLSIYQITSSGESTLSTTTLSTNNWEDTPGMTRYLWIRWLTINSIWSLQYGLGNTFGRYKVGEVQPTVVYVKYAAFIYTSNDTLGYDQGSATTGLHVHSITNRRGSRISQVMSNLKRFHSLISCGGLGDCDSTSATCKCYNPNLSGSHCQVCSSNYTGPYCSVPRPCHEKHPFQPHIEKECLAWTNRGCQAVAYESDFYIPTRNQSIYRYRLGY